MKVRRLFITLLIPDSDGQNVTSESSPIGGRRRLSVAAFCPSVWLYTVGDEWSLLMYRHCYTLAFLSIALCGLL